eukprot:374238_1
MTSNLFATVILAVYYFDCGVSLLCYSGDPGPIAMLPTANDSITCTNEDACYFRTNLAQKTAHRYCTFLASCGDNGEEGCEFWMQDGYNNTACCCTTDNCNLYESLALKYSNTTTTPSPETSSPTTTKTTTEYMQSTTTTTESQGNKVLLLNVYLLLLLMVVMNY